MVSRAFREDMKRAFSSPIAWLAILLPLGMGIYSIWSESMEALKVGKMAADTTSTWEFILMYNFTPAIFAFPLICMLPLGVSFCDEFTFGYYKPLITRIGLCKYTVSRILSTAFSGGLVLMLCTGLSVLYCIIFFKPYLAETPQILGDIKQWQLSSFFPESGPTVGYAYMAFRVLLSFFFGCAWSTLGLAVSSIYPNRYVALAGPFLLYCCLWYVGIIVNFRYLDASETINPRFFYSLPIWYFLAYDFVLFSISSVLFYLGVRKRVVNG